MHLFAAYIRGIHVLRCVECACEQNDEGETTREVPCLPCSHVRVSKSIESSLRWRHDTTHTCDLPKSTRRGCVSCVVPPP